MTIGAVFIGLALLVVAAAFVLRPLKERGENDRFPPQENQPPQFEAVLTALRDLDFDHRTGKVSDQDYRPARASLLAQAAEVIDRPSGASARDDLEAKVREMRLRLGEGRALTSCRACGGRLLAGDRFCPLCGSAQAGTCPSCGRTVGHEDRFCAECGCRLNASAAAIA